MLTGNRADFRCLAVRPQFFVWLAITFLVGELGTRHALAADHVIHISVDGLNAGVLQSIIEAGQAPNFKRLDDEGAFTLNARTDFTYTTTLPNHATILTGRPVLVPENVAGMAVHGWTSNGIPRRGMTLHQHGYVPSVFDVVHDAGGSTALFGSKDKFVLFDQSYDETNGALPNRAVSPKLPNANVGEPRPRARDKIDTFYASDDGPPKFSETLNERFIAGMSARHFTYAFVHYRDPDSVGHVLRWGSGTYRWAVGNVDEYLGAVLRLVETDPQLTGKTAIIVTSDHGGSGFAHGNPTLKENYTIPVFVWGAGVAHGDLYELNRETRRNPGDERIDYAAEHQPIRNGDTGNLALSLLGLGPIPTSVLNSKQDLHVGSH
jgi:arylsulfatase A-like enzyme